MIAAWASVWERSPTRHEPRGQSYASVQDELQRRGDAMRAFVLALVTLGAAVPAVGADRAAAAPPPICTRGQTTVERVAPRAASGAMSLSKLEGGVGPERKPGRSPAYAEAETSARSCRRHDRARQGSQPVRSIENRNSTERAGDRALRRAEFRLQSEKRAALRASDRDAGELFDAGEAGGDLGEAVVPERAHAGAERGALDLLAASPSRPRARRAPRSSRGAGRCRSGPCSRSGCSAGSRACGRRPSRRWRPRRRARRAPRSAPPSTACTSRSSASRASARAAARARP